MFSVCIYLDGYASLLDHGEPGIFPLWLLTSIEGFFFSLSQCRISDQQWFVQHKMVRDGQLCLQAFRLSSVAVIPVIHPMTSRNSDRHQNTCQMWRKGLSADFLRKKSTEPSILAVVNMINIKLRLQSITSDTQWTRNSGSNPGYIRGNVEIYIGFIDARVSH